MRIPNYSATVFLNIFGSCKGFQKIQNSVWKETSETFICAGVEKAKNYLAQKLVVGVMHFLVEFQFLFVYW